MVERSPRVSHVSWGRLEIETPGGAETGKDLKLFPGGARAWDWSETGTRHSPGIQPADVRELLDHGAVVVVLSRGMELRLETTPEALAMLEAAGVRVHVEETTAAVDLYNRLAAAGEPVGALLHSTC
ncbi:Mth938-like domain-containing protein [Spirillospora sp. NPDC047279]|uniref:Mth938-like domain-containing protein n=1 Tax=Spirillospora sp. NPDC047279 TaxID=3155478 RepID=UPI0034094AD6